MKRSHLKSLIKQIVKESLSIKKEVMMGQERDDHRFDDGRQNVMRAVNVGENQEDKYNFKNGDKVKLTSQYAGQHANEIFTLSQWNGDKGWIGDKDGRGWFVRGFQIILAKKLQEMSDSGGAGSYQTPAWGTKNKDGSPRALDVTTRMGFKKVKSIS